MPTSAGGETIAERLARKRLELVRARRVIERAENNGASFSMGGVQVTQIALERAEARVSRLESEIRGLEARLAGSPARSGIAVTRTAMPSS